MRPEKPRLCVVGQLLGRNPGYITTQGQIIADLFQKEGHDIISVSSKINRLFRLIDVIWTIFRKRKSIDIMIVDVYSGLSFFLADSASSISRFFRIPTVFVLRGGNLPEFTRRNHKWVKRVLKRSDLLVAPSTFLTKEMEQYGLTSRVIPNIVALDAYPYKFRNKISPKLIWMRSFHPIYNPQLALDVFALIRRDHPKATLVMAGADKGLKNEIKNSACRMGLNNSVRFPGFLEKSSKIREFSNADIYLNTNKIDNMPVSVVEACAMGLPVVATNVGGISNLLKNGVNGLLVPDDDAPAMASAIGKLLTDPELTGMISKNARLLAERSAWANIQKDWEDVFTELLNRSGRQKNGIATDWFETSSG